MDEGSQYKLKISINNTNSDDEDSDTGSDNFKHNRRPTTSSVNNSGDEGFKDKELDNDETTLSVALDTDRPKVSEQRIKTYKNKAGAFEVGFDLTSEECRERQEQRAKRFGDSVTGIPLTDEAIQKLYESLGVSQTSDKEDGSITRFDTIHIHGVDEMSTTRVFDYFGEFAPSAIEWIDDTSCNVVWMDRIIAARAMLKMSTNEADASKDNGSDPSEIDVQKDNIDVVDEREAASAIPAKEAEESKSMEDDDDDLNLLSDDDVAKLSLSTVTAEENRAEIEKRRSSVAEDRGLASKARAAETGQEEEDMEVDDELNHARVTEQRKSICPDRRSSVTLETDHVADQKRRQRVRSREKPVEMPPGKWRVGVPHPRTNRLYMRFATKDDIKQPGAGKRSKYYQKYGNPNFGGMKGIISGSRKRKIFSKQYQDELEEARKAIEEAKWKRGVPDETRFDQHIEEAVTKRPKVTRERKEPVSSAESDNDSLDELVVEQSHREVRPTVKQRFMRMHADEEQSRCLSDRLGARNHSRVSSNVRDRLGLTTESLHVDSDSRRRTGRSDIGGDLRNRLSRR